MEIIAIERFTEKTYLRQSDKLLAENHLFIEKLYTMGKIRQCWSRSDQDGTVLMMNAKSVQEAKEILKSSPLVQKKILTYSVVPLDDYQFDSSLSRARDNFILIYASAQARELDSNELEKILKTARKRNTKMKVTGMLVYQNGSFLQVLEGHRHNVEALFKKIETDSRHTNIVKVLVYYSSDRIFSDWSMGFADVTQEDLESIEGLNDFFSNGNSLVDIQTTEAKNILTAFKEGKWRQHIS